MSDADDLDDLDDVGVLVAIGLAALVVYFVGYGK
jgi:hypothetical protein